MASYTENNIKSIMSWANAFSRLNPDVLDRTSLWGSLEDARKYAKGDPKDPDSRGLQGTSYVGQPIVVYENGTVKQYLIQEDRTLKESGNSEEMVFPVESFSAATDLAIDKNVGKIVVLKEDDGDYDKGLYIITGEGAVSKLGLTAADGSDYSTLIQALTTRVAALESLTDGLYWETDEDLVIE